MKEEHTNRSSSTPTLKEFAVPLFAYLKTNMAPSTVLLYESGFKQFEKTCGNLPLDKYTVMKIEEFKTKRLQGVSPVKVNIDFRVLRAASNIMGTKSKSIYYFCFDNIFATLSLYGIYKL